jgi:hypothetical protein
VSGREGLDLRAPVLVERLQLRGEDDRVVAACPVERSHAERVAGGDEAPVVARDREGELAPEALEGVDALVVEEVKRGLVVRARVKALVAQLGAEAVVVVEAPVPDEPQVALGVPDRLTAVLEIYDRKSPVTEPRISDPARSLAVGSPVCKPCEHAPTEVGLERAVRGDDA